MSKLYFLKSSSQSVQFVYMYASTLGTNHALVSSQLQHPRVIQSGTINLKLSILAPPSLHCYHVSAVHWQKKRVVHKVTSSKVFYSQLLLASLFQQFYSIISSALLRSCVNNTEDQAVPQAIPQSGCNPQPHPIYKQVWSMHIECLCFHPGNMGRHLPRTKEHFHSMCMCLGISLQTHLTNS